MKRLRSRTFRWIAGLLLALSLTLMPVSAALATNPTVTMTVTAGIISITNTQSTWALGTATVNEVIYFSATNAQDDNYSTIENTGSVNATVQIQGTDFEGGSYDWVLAAAAGSEQYSLYANSGNGTSTYNIEVKSSAYGDIVADFGPSATWVWSMKFTAPSAFDASDDKAQKSATVTLVARELGT